MRMKLLKLIKSKFIYDIVQTDIIKDQIVYSKPEQIVVNNKFYTDFKGNLHIKRPKETIKNGIVLKIFNHEQTN